MVKCNKMIEVIDVKYFNSDVLNAAASFKNVFACFYSEIYNH